MILSSGKSTLKKEQISLLSLHEAEKLLQKTL